jgi:hypothetical protein
MPSLRVDNMPDSQYYDIDFKMIKEDPSQENKQSPLHSKRSSCYINTLEDDSIEDEIEILSESE